MNKIKIHQFDPVIYPVYLWVIISNKLSAIEDLFIDSETKSTLDLSDVGDHVDAFICSEYVTNKDSGTVDS